MQPVASGSNDGISMSDALRPLVGNFRILALALVAGAGLGFAASLLVPPRFTAEATFILPQPPESAAVSSSGTLNALATAAGGGRNTAEQYMSMMESVTIRDRIIRRFGLMAVYDKPTMEQVRAKLAGYTRLSAARKDAMIHVEVEDVDPKRAADIANDYIEELRWLTGRLAMTEAQRRRVFFENLLRTTKDNLTSAQVALESSGITGNALKAQPAAAAEGYAQIKAELTAEEVKLQVLRARLADTAPEVRSELAAIDALRSKLASMESSGGTGGQAGSSSSYTTKLREFKYNEVLMEMYARQYELARADEARDGVLIQSLDIAAPPERKSSPKRLLWVLGGAGSMLFLTAASILVRSHRRRAPSGHEAA